MSNKLTTEVRMQQHPAECGAVCLGVVLQWFGHDYATSHLRTICGVSRDGATVAQLQKGAVRLGFKSIVKKKGLNALKKLTQPVILHWNLNHFVVLERINNDRAFINDPAQGRRTLSLAQLAEHFTGICIEFEDKNQTSTHSKSKSTFFEYLYPIISNKAWKYALLPGLMLMLLEIIYAGLFHAYYDVAIVNNLKDWVAIIGLSGIITIMLSWLINRISLKIQLYVNQDIEHRLNQSLINNLAKKNIDFFESHYDGEISNRLTGLKSLSRQLGQVVLSFYHSVSFITLSLLLILLINPPLFMVTLLPYLLLLSYRYTLQKNIKEYTIAKSRAEVEFNNQLNQRLFELKRFATMGLRYEIMSTMVEKVSTQFAPDARLKNSLLRYQTLSQTVDSVTPALMLFCSCYLLIKGELSFGAYSFTYMLSLTTLPKIKLFQSQLDDYFNNKDVSNDSEEFLTVTEAKFDHNNHNPVDNCDSQALFQLINLGFGYNGIDSDLLSNVHLTIYKGDILCLIGNSGSGKSTLFDLLSGQRAPIEGYALYKGKPAYKMVDAGFVFSQERIHGSLTDFLCSDKQADKQQLLHILKLVELESRLGFHIEANDDTPIDPEQFSAGELQRLSLARALYYNSDIIFFDEAFSHVDIDTSERIITRLKQQKTTLIMVSHRTEISNLADFQFRV
ncbi:MAG: cysteine peptidase family C39 domain-containing protein [Parashewanella sp.]